jgi:GNAT superfamily N-acetyltransferase
MILQILPLTPEHQDFLWEMLYQAVHVPAGSPAPDRDIVRHPALSKYARDWGGADDLGFVAECDGTDGPVAAVWLRRYGASDPGYGTVDDATPELSIAVAPGFRGRGIGTRLLESILAAAEGRYRAVSLSVAAGNPARRLYERFGFRTVKVTDDSLVMMRTSGGIPRPANPDLPVECGPDGD